jgi:hypothetical protein
MGPIFLEKIASTITGFPEEKLLLLQHLMLSHHGELEKGSPVTPKLLEAVVLHYADELDARISTIDNFIQTSADGRDGPWTNYNNKLGSHFMATPKWPVAAQAQDLEAKDSQAQYLQPDDSQALDLQPQDLQAQDSQAQDLQADAAASTDDESAPSHLKDYSDRFPDPSASSRLKARPLQSFADAPSELDGSCACCAKVAEESRIPDACGKELADAAETQINFRRDQIDAPSRLGTLGRLEPLGPDAPSRVQSADCNESRDESRLPHQLSETDILMSTRQLHCDQSFDESQSQNAGRNTGMTDGQKIDASSKTVDASPKPRLF